MSEYTSIRTSSWDVDAMVTKLNEHAKQGWSLVSVVNTGADLAAILTRGGSSPDSSTSSAAAASSVATADVVTAPVTPEPVVVESIPVEVVPVAATPAATPVTEPAGWGSAVESAAEVAPMAIEPMPSNDNASSSASAAVDAAVTPIETVAAVEAVVTPIETVAAAAVTSTPAGWYPDPSGRFEMRYWDGSAWTEHVARGGQQYTDPPIA